VADRGSASAFTWLLAGAALVRLLAFWATHAVFAFETTGVIHGSGAYDLYARNLIASGVYGLTPGAPDAVLPPLYGVMLAAVYRIAGRAALGVVLFNVACDLIAIAALRRVILRVLPEREALAGVAATFVACYPYLVFQSLTVIDTSLFVAELYVLLALIAALGDRSRDRAVWRRAAAAGVVLGLSLLTRPILPLLVVLAIPWMARRAGWQRAAVSMSAMAVVAAVVLSPWVVRNYRVFGAFVPFSTNGGSNFWQGNNPETVAYLRAGFDVQWIRPDPIRAPDRLGLEADREFAARALAYLRDNPGDIPALAWTKFRVLWSLGVAPRRNPAAGDAIEAYGQPLFERAGRTVHRVYWGALLALGLFGLVLTLRQWRDVSLLWLPPVTITIAYVVMHPSTRYRVPADPAWFAFAAVALVHLVSIVRGRRRTTVHRAATASGEPPCVCWIGATAYRQPLEPGAARKWRALARLGASMHVIGFSADGRPRTFEQHATFHLLRRPRSPLLRYLVFFTTAPVTLVRVARGPTVVVAQSPYEGAVAALACALLRRRGRRAALVIESHGDFEQGLFLQRRPLFPGLMRRVMRRTADYALRHADAGRAVSESARRQLATRAPALPIVIFPAWVDAETFDEGAPRPPPSACRTLIYAGALVPGKGVHLLVDAMARRPDPAADATLVIAGPDTNPAYAARLRARVAAHGLSDRITFVGELAPPDLARRFDTARAVVLPSYSEGLPRVALEAMLRGTPVLAARVGGVPELIRDGETGYLVEPGDVEALAREIGRVFTDPAIDAVAARGRTAAREKASADRFVSAHRDLLQFAAGPLSPP
jgi:glycosyltransferase involved in cell wall biosynthesis